MSRSQSPIRFLLKSYGLRTSLKPRVGNSQLRVSGSLPDPRAMSGFRMLSGAGANPPPFRGFAIMANYDQAGGAPGSEAATKLDIA
jgi:hypothetical protein